MYPVRQMTYAKVTIATIAIKIPLSDKSQELKKSWGGFCNPPVFPVRSSPCEDEISKSLHSRRRHQ